MMIASAGKASRSLSRIFTCFFSEVFKALPMVFLIEETICFLWEISGDFPSSFSFKAEIAVAASPMNADGKKDAVQVGNVKDIVEVHDVGPHLDFDGIAAKDGCRGAVAHQNKLITKGLVGVKARACETRVGGGSGVWASLECGGWSRCSGVAGVGHEAIERSKLDPRCP